MAQGRTPSDEQLWGPAGICQEYKYTTKQNTGAKLNIIYISK